MGLRCSIGWHWNIEVKVVDGRWLVGAGHKVLLKTESRDAADAFIYGVALAHSLLPRKLLEQLRKQMDSATQ